MSDKNVLRLHWSNRLVKLSISTKIVITFIFLTVIPGAIVYFFSTSLIATYLKNNSAYRLEQNINGIEEILGYDEKRLRDLIKFLNLNECFKNKLNLQEFRFISVLFNNLLSDNGRLNLLVLTDDKGRILASNRYHLKGEWLEIPGRLGETLKEMSYFTILKDFKLSPSLSEDVLAKVYVKSVKSAVANYYLIGINIFNNNERLNKKIYETYKYYSYTVMMDDIPKIVAKNISDTMNKLPINIFLKGENLKAFFVKSEGNEFTVFKFPFEDYEHNIAGFLIVVSELTNSYAILEKFRNIIITALIVVGFMILLIGYIVYHDTKYPIEYIKKGMELVSDGKLNTRLDFKTYDDFEDIANYFNEMAENIEIYTKKINKYNELSDIISTSLNTTEILENTLKEIMDYSKSQIGAIYLYSEDRCVLKPFVGRNIELSKLEEVPVGEGLIGTVAKERSYFCLTDLNKGNLILKGGLFDLYPNQTACFSIVYKEKLLGVLFIGTIYEYDQNEIELIKSILSHVAVVLDNAIMHNEIYRLAIRDQLTGVYNRHYLMELLQKEFAKAKRLYDYNFCLVIFDLDDFKKINDTYGHLVGDEVLKVFAKSVKGSIRAIDSFGRFGGEEFVLIIANSSKSSAIHVLERIISNFKEMAGNHFGFRITFSAGLVCFDEKSYNSVEEMIKDADRKLYRAKREGKNRFVV